jgi:hypothetical protein
MTAPALEVEFRLFRYNGTDPADRTEVARVWVVSEHAAELNKAMLRLPYRLWRVKDPNK